jgi:hypothetical protein
VAIPAAAAAGAISNILAAAVAVKVSSIQVLRRKAFSTCCAGSTANADAVGVFARAVTILGSNILQAASWLSGEACSTMGEGLEQSLLQLCCPGSASESQLGRWRVVSSSPQPSLTVVTHHIYRRN